MLTAKGWKIQYHGMGGGVPDFEGPAVDNSVWNAIKAAYAKRDKALNSKDIAAISALETDDYTQISKPNGTGDPVTLDKKAADKATEALFSIKGDLPWATKLWAVNQGKEKNTVVVAIRTVRPTGEYMADDDRTDTWILTPDGWKIKQRSN